MDSDLSYSGTVELWLRIFPWNFLLCGSYFAGETLNNCDAIVVGIVLLVLVSVDAVKYTRDWVT